jgi:hypothetical protein
MTRGRPVGGRRKAVSQFDREMLLCATFANAADLVRDQCSGDLEREVAEIVCRLLQSCMVVLDAASITAPETYVACTAEPGAMARIAGGQNLGAKNPTRYFAFEERLDQAARAFLVAAEGPNGRVDLAARAARAQDSFDRRRRDAAQRAAVGDK